MPKKGTINNPNGRPKEGRETRSLSFRVDVKHFDAFDVHCLEHGARRSDVLKEIFINYMESLNAN